MFWCNSNQILFVLKELSHRVHKVLSWFLPTVNETFRRYLTDDVAKTVERSYNFLLKLVERIASGRIKIGELQWLLKHPQEFQHVVHTLVGDGGSYACHALHLRKKEMEEFQSVNQDINCVLRFCQNFIETSKEFLLSLSLVHLLTHSLASSLFLSLASSLFLST